MRIAIAAALLVALTGCAGQYGAAQTAPAAAAAPAPTAPVKQELPREVVPNLVSSDTPFSKGGTVSLQELDLLTKIRVSKIEQGEVSGVKYRFYYSDGSGSFAGAPGNDLKSSERATNWSVKCDKDAMTEKVSCYAITREFGIFAYPDGSELIALGVNHYPGSKVAVKVGTATPLEADARIQFDATQSKALLARMKNGTQIVTRYQEWPSKRNKDQVFTLFGVEEVRSYLQWAVQRIQ
ncbi:MAG TPA: hypothetical protein VL178_13405 [Pseudomonas sp.]|nr:hypothetical protein [Pseudomonas sp.]